MPLLNHRRAESHIKEHRDTMGRSHRLRISYGAHCSEWIVKNNDAAYRRALAGCSLQAASLIAQRRPFRDPSVISVWEVFASNPK